MRCASVLILTTLVFLLLAPPISVRGDDPSQPPSLGVLWALHSNLEGYHTKVLYQDGLVILIGDRKALALDPESVEEVWSLDGLGGKTTQLLLDEGMLYLHNNGRLHAVDPRTGEVQWRVPQGPSSWSDVYLLPPPPADAGLLMADEQLYISAARHLRAVAPDSGRVLWTTATIPKNATGHGYGTPGLCRNVIVSRFIDGQIVGVDAMTGEKRWAFPIRFDWGTDRFQVAAGRVYALKDYRETYKDGGQLYALEGQSGQPLWSYPDTEEAPPVDGGLMIKEGIVYTFIGRRLTALSADTGRLLWQSDTATGVDYTQLFTFGDVILSSGVSKVAVNAQSGSTLWHRDNNGRIIDVLSNTVLIAEPADATASSRGSSDELALRLTDPVTGDTRHVIRMTLRLEEWDASVASAGSDAFFLYSKSYLYAFGPPDPASTVARARTFLTQGDYRSAAHTLRLLKANDLEGYREADGESVAVAALTIWLDEVQALFDSGQISKAENLLGAESKSLSDLDSDLEAEAASLELRDILARRQYILTEIALMEYDPKRYPYYKTPRDIPEYRKLKGEYSDTEWAALIEQHPIWRDLLFRPRGINLTGWMWFIPTGWIWFIPLVLPLLYFAGSCLSKSRRLYVREQVIVTLFCIWASYLYLWQREGILFGFLNELARAGSVCSGVLSGTLTLTVAAPLVSWLLTMRKERRYGIEALALNWLNWLVLLGVSR